MRSRSVASGEERAWRRRLRAWAAVLALVAAPSLGWAQGLTTERVVLITLDGLRWQEVFGGADPVLIDDPEFVDTPARLRARFWASDETARRVKLMPFLWDVVARRGQIYGNRRLGNRVSVTNGHRFSYPGYNEILTGMADPRIDSNDKVLNPNVTVLEALHERPGFRGRVAAFGSWDVFPFIINESRSGIPVNAGFRGASEVDASPRERFLNVLQRQIPSPWTSVRLDAFTHHYALEYLRRREPRVIYIAYGETDDFAHDGAYDAYLIAAHRTDAFIREVWTWVQTHDAYRDRTTMLITTDHGRGTNPRSAWRGHGADVDGADEIWLAAIGPDTPPTGEARAAGQYFQNQVARTIAALLGVDYGDNPRVGDAITAVLGR